MADMFEEITIGHVLDGGPWVLVVFAVVAIFRGNLVVRKSHEREIQIVQADADRWRTAWEVSQQAHELKDRHIGELLELAHTSAAALEAIRRAGTE